MSALDDSNRAAYRRDLLAEVVEERFRPKPAPPQVDDTPAARARILHGALTDHNGRNVPLAPRRAA